MEGALRSSMEAGLRFLLVCVVWIAACGSDAPSITSNRPAVNGPPAAETQANEVGGRTKNTDGFKVKKDMTEETNISQLVLSGKAEKTKDALVIEYEAQNNSNQTLYLWDRIPDYPDSGPIVSPDLAYVFFDGPKTLIVIRANLTLPKSIRVATKETPYLRPVEPGSKANGRISLKLPVAEFSPYFGYAREDNAELSEISEVRLLIGWTDYREGMKLEETTIGGEKVFVMGGNWPKPYQRIAEKRFPVTVPVLVAKSDFERTMPLQ